MEEKIKKIYNHFSNNKFPYLFFMCMLSIIVILSLYSRGILPGDDMWWHVKSGEKIAQGNFPFIDPFSWVYEGKNIYWVSHEWLTDLFLYTLVNLFGINSMFFYTVILDIIIIFLLIYFNKEKISKNIILSIIWFLPCMLTLTMFSTARPHLIGFVLLTIFMYILFDFMDNEDSKKIYWLPFISILWVNFHGGSSNLVYILPIIGMLMSFKNMEFGKIKIKQLSKKQFKILLFITILNFFCLFINPHTYRTVLYPFEGMSEEFQLSFIAEWKSPNIATTTGFVTLMVPIVMTIYLISNKKKLVLSDFAYFGFFALLTLKSIRFAPFFLIVNTFIFFKYIPEFYPFQNKLLKRFKNDAKVCLILSSAILGFAYIPSFLNYCNTTIQKNENHSLIYREINDEFIEAIKKDNPQRIYNHYNFGGLLIYNDIKVFVDSRADLYWGEILETAIDLTDMEDTPKGSYDFNFYETIKKYDFDAFLTYKDDALYRFIKDKYEIKIIHENNKVVYFRVIDDMSEK